MRKILYFLVIGAFFAAGVISCSEEDATYTVPVSSFKVLNANVKFGAESGTGSIVYEGGSKVVFSCDASWVSLSQEGNNTIGIKVTANEALEGRVAIVTLSDGVAQQNVVLQQLGLAFGYFDNLFEIPSTGDQFTIEGKCTIPIEVKNASDWIHLAPFDGGFDVIVDTTLMGSSRTDTVLLVAGGCVAKNVFHQKGVFNYKGGTLSASFKADSSIVIMGNMADDITASVKGGKDWLTVKADSAGYRLYLQANLSQEAREAVVTLSCADQIATYKVSQAACLYMNVMITPDSASRILIVDDAAAVHQYTYEANSEFSLSTSADWIRVGFKNKKLSLEVDQNMTGSTRRAYVYYSFENFVDSIEIRQVDPFKDLAGNGILFYWNEAKQQVGYYDVVIQDNSIAIPAFASLSSTQTPWKFTTFSDAEKKTISIANATLMGDYSGQIDIYAFVVGTDKKIDDSPSISCVATPMYSVRMGGIVAVFEAADPDFGFSGLSLYAFKGGSPVQQLLYLPVAYLYIPDPSDNVGEEAAPARFGSSFLDKVDFYVE